MVTLRRLEISLVERYPVVVPRELELEIFQRLVLERDALNRIIRQKAVMLFGLSELRESKASG